MWMFTLPPPTTNGSFLCSTNCYKKGGISSVFQSQFSLKKSICEIMLFKNAALLVSMISVAMAAPAPEAAGPTSHLDKRGLLSVSSSNLYTAVTDAVDDGTIDIMGGMMAQGEEDPDGVPNYVTKPATTSTFWMLGPVRSVVPKTATLQLAAGTVTSTLPLSTTTLVIPARTIFSTAPALTTTIIAPAETVYDTDLAYTETRTLQPGVYSYIKSGVSYTKTRAVASTQTRIVPATTNAIVFPAETNVQIIPAITRSTVIPASTIFSTVAARVITTYLPARPSTTISTVIRSINVPTSTMSQVFPKRTEISY
jgi:hypothetical protein